MDVDGDAVDGRPRGDATRPKPRLGPILVGAGILALVVADLHMKGDVLVRPEPRPVDRWLAAQPGHFRTIQLPWLRGQSGTSLYYSAYNGKDVTLAQASVLPDAVVQAHDALYYTFPLGRDWVDALERWDVRYVLVDESLDPIPRVEQIIEDRGLRLTTRRGSVAVFELPKQRSSARVKMAR
jgi:hypothetical protein